MRMISMIDPSKATQAEIDAVVTGINTFAIIAKTDLKGKITFVNDKFCKVSGYNREELIGKDHRIINSGFHDKDFFKNIWQKILSGNPWRGDIKNKKKDGNNI